MVSKTENAHKAEQMEVLANDNGWDTQLNLDGIDELERTGQLSELVWTLYAKRGRETIKVVWRGNRQEEAKYTFGKNHRIIWWKSEVLRYLTSEPKETKEIPWKEDSPAIDIMKACLRKTITWTRSIDGQECESFVDVDLREEGSAKHFRVYESKNGRILEWADGYGFHSIALDRIVSVS